MFFKVLFSLLICTFFVVIFLPVKDNDISIKVDEENSTNEDKFESRRSTIFRVCRDHAKSFWPRHYYTRRNYVLDKRHRLSYCAVPKAATTTWTNYFRRLAGLKATVMGGHKACKKFYWEKLLNESDRALLARPAQGLRAFNELNKMVTFTFVRNPYDR